MSGPPGGPALGPRNPLTSRWWRLRHSAWVLWPVLSMGLLAWVGFVHVGVRVRRRTWWLAGASYFAVGAVALFVLPDDDGHWDDLSSTLVIGVWAASSVHALLVNRSWLRALAAASARPWFAQPAPPAAPLRPPPLQPPPLPPAPGAEVLDVNAASAAQLADLEELNATQAEFVVSVRSVRGPFPSVEAFADVAGLQPHQLARLRGRIAAGAAAVGAVAPPVAPPFAAPPAGRVVGL